MLVAQHKSLEPVWYIRRCCITRTPEAQAKRMQHNMPFDNTEEEPWESYGRQSNAYKSAVACNACIALKFGPKAEHQ